MYIHLIFHSNNHLNKCVYECVYHEVYDFRFGLCLSQMSYFIWCCLVSIEYIFTTFFYVVPPEFKENS